MKKEQIKPNDITYCTLISVSDKGQNWKLALKFLQEMKQEGYGINIIAYSSSISALSKVNLFPFHKYSYTLSRLSKKFLILLSE